MIVTYILTEGHVGRDVDTCGLLVPLRKGAPVGERGGGEGGGGEEEEEEELHGGGLGQGPEGTALWWKTNIWFTILDHIVKCSQASHMSQIIVTDRTG